MSIGNTVNITQLGLFPGPFITKNPEGSYTNVNLNNNVGTYTVYKIFQSNSNPNSNYKMYVVSVNLTNMTAGQASVSNALPSPYIATRGFTYPNVVVSSGTGDGRVKVDVMAGGQFFRLDSIGSTNTGPMKFAFFILGY